MTHAINPVTTAETSFVKEEPMMAGAIAAAVIGFVLSLLVVRGVISSTTASTLTQQLVPPLTSLCLLGLGGLARMFVTPAAVATARLEAGIQAAIGGLPVVAPIAGLVSITDLPPLLPGEAANV